MKKLIYIFSMMLFFSCNDASSEEAVDGQSFITKNYTPDYLFSKESFEEEGQLNKEPVTIEAFLMQYACGDENDDMQQLARKLWKKRAKEMGIDIDSVS